MTVTCAKLLDQIKSLPCWSHPITVEPLLGGLTNQNFLVRHNAQKWVVRIAEDIPIHGILRRHELSALQAAEKIGIAPRILYTAYPVLVTQYIEGQVLNLTLLKAPQVIPRVISLIRQAHDALPLHLPIPAVLFWVFHVNRSYLSTLNTTSCRLQSELFRFSHCNQQLEKKCQPRSLVFGHNDLLAANFIDDGKKLWLIDWEYAGFGDPLFDLAGLASNHDFSPEEQEWLLEAYFEKKVEDPLRQQLSLMKCAAALREMLWSLVAEQNSNVKAVDYVSYTEQNRARFWEAYRIWNN